MLITQFYLDTCPIRFITFAALPFAVGSLNVGSIFLFRYGFKMKLKWMFCKQSEADTERQKHVNENVTCYKIFPIQISIFLQYLRLCETNRPSLPVTVELQQNLCPAEIKEAGVSWVCRQGSYLKWNFICHTSLNQQSYSTCSFLVLLLRVSGQVRSARWAYAHDNI